MVTLTERARQGIADFMKNKSAEPIRVYPRRERDGTLSLALALDKVHDEIDEVEEVNGFTFCMNRQLKRMIQHVTVDLGKMGFICNPLIPLPKMAPQQGCGSFSCGGNCSGCH